MKRSTLMAGTAALVIAAAAGGAWFTRVAGTAPPSQASKAGKALSGAAEAAGASADSSQATIALPDAVPPPADPTSADFSRNAPAVKQDRSGPAGDPIDWAAM